MKEYQGGRTVISIWIKKILKIWSIIPSIQSRDFIKYLTNPDAPEDTPAAEPFGTYPGSEHVLMLSDNDFDTKISTFKKSLVMFYAPCKYNATTTHSPFGPKWINFVI